MQKGIGLSDLKKLIKTMKFKILIILIILDFSCYSQNHSKANLENDKQVGTFKHLIEFDTALNQSRINNKPLLLYFTCYACVNAIKMQYDILANPEIKTIIDNNFISYSAYVDDQSKLNIKSQYISKFTGKMITTVGDKLLELQIEKFKTEFQPYAVIVDPNGNILDYINYSSDLNLFMKFLEDGMKKYSQSKK